MPDPGRVGRARSDARAASSGRSFVSSARPGPRTAGRRAVGVSRTSARRISTNGAYGSASSATSRQAPVNGRAWLPISPIEPLHEAALADAGLAADDHAPAATRCSGVVQGPLEVADLNRPTDERPAAKCVCHGARIIRARTSVQPGNPYSSIVSRTLRARGTAAFGSRQASARWTLRSPPGAARTPPGRAPVALRPSGRPSARDGGRCRSRSRWLPPPARRRYPAEAARRSAGPRPAGAARGSSRGSGRPGGATRRDGSGSGRPRPRQRAAGTLPATRSCAASASRQMTVRRRCSATWCSMNARLDETARGVLHPCSLPALPAGRRLAPTVALRRQGADGAGAQIRQGGWLKPRLARMLSFRWKTFSGSHASLELDQPHSNFASRYARPRPRVPLADDVDVAPVPHGSRARAPSPRVAPSGRRPRPGPTTLPRSIHSTSVSRKLNADSSSRGRRSRRRTPGTRIPGMQDQSGLGRVRRRDAARKEGIDRIVRGARAVVAGRVAAQAVAVCRSSNWLWSST